MVNAWIKADVRVKVPASCLVRLHGKLRPGVEAKDIVFHLLRLPYLREGRAIEQVFEYSGEVVAALPTDERATLINMVAEIGDFTDIVVPDAETVRFLRERRSVEVELEDWMGSDPDAEYAHVIDVDCSALEPMLGAPRRPRTRRGGFGAARPHASGYRVWRLLHRRQARRPAALF